MLADSVPQPVPQGAGAQCPEQADRLAAVDQLSRELQRFLRLVRKVSAQFPQQKDGVEFAAYGLLAHVVCEGPRRTTALAEAVHSDTSTVSRQTAALVRHGLLERRPDPEDGRASLLAATPEGERVFGAKRRARNERIARMLAAWRVPEVYELITMLARLNTDFETFDPEREDAVAEGDGPRQTDGPPT